MNAKRGSARERIMEAASTLFYEQGYQATTVEQVIERSGVSRPTVYAHFSTKEELCAAYMQGRREAELALLRQEVRKEKSAEKRFLRIIGFVREQLLGSNYRGCGFFNMICEIPQQEHPVVAEAYRYIDGVREVIEQTVSELRRDDPRYEALDTPSVAEKYYVIVCGAIMASQEMRQPWPLDRAVELVENLLEKQ